MQISASHFRFPSERSRPATNHTDQKQSKVLFETWVENLARDKLRLSAKGNQPPWESSLHSSPPHPRQRQVFGELRGALFMPAYSEVNPSCVCGVLLPDIHGHGIADRHRVCLPEKTRLRQNGNERSPPQRLFHEPSLGPWGGPASFSDPVLSTAAGGEAPGVEQPLLFWSRLGSPPAGRIPPDSLPYIPSSASNIACAILEPRQQRQSSLNGHCGKGKRSSLGRQRERAATGRGGKAV